MNMEDSLALAVRDANEKTGASCFAHVALDLTLFMAARGLPDMEEPLADRVRELTGRVDELDRLVAPSAQSSS